MSPAPRDNRAQRIRDAFTAVYRQDAARHELRDLADYQKLFDGYEREIADWYRDLASTKPTQSRAPETPSQDELEQLGPYKILRQIGKGGQGIVYLAQDERLGRRVAVKILREFTTENLVRFQREAEVASRLDDPGICTIYDSGQIDGYYFIAMRFIDGEPLSAQVHRARHNPDAEASDLVQIAHCPSSSRTMGSRASGSSSSAARPASSSHSHRTALDPTLLYFERAARALHTAHEAALIHRDIKPGNLMVSRDGLPVLLDFGLAREDDPEENFTAISANVGTPEYMSPEQIDPRVLGDHRIDRRTDIYSLGITLYECLTLHRPFEAPNWATQIAKVMQSDLPNPAKYNPKVTRDLRAVLEMATEKDVDRRYRTAQDFAEELRRIRENEPILAQPTGSLRRVGKWARRNPVLASALLGLTLFVIILSALLVKLDDTYTKLAAEQNKVAEDRVARNRQAFGAFDTAEFMMEHGKWHEARQEFERARTLGYDDTIALALGVARSFFGEMKFQAARELLTTLDCSLDDKHYGDLLLLRGILTPTDLQHPDAGLDLVRQALETNTLTPVDRAFARATIAETIEDVRRNLDRALRLDRHHIHANQAQAIVLLHSGEFAEALSFAQTYLALFPNDQLGYLIVAVCTRQLKGRREYLQYMESLPAHISAQTREQFGYFAGTFELFRVLETELLLALTHQQRKNKMTRVTRRGRHLRLQIKNHKRVEFADYLNGTLPFVANRIADGLERGERLIHCRLPLAIGRAWSTLARVFTLIQMNATTSDDFVDSMTQAIAHTPDGVFYLLRGQVLLGKEKVAAAFDDFKLATRHGSLFNIENTSHLLALHTATELLQSTARNAADGTASGSRSKRGSSKGGPSTSDTAGRPQRLTNRQTSKNPAKSPSSYSSNRLRSEVREAIHALFSRDKQSWLIYKFCIDLAVKVNDYETAAEAADHWIRFWPGTPKPWIEKSRILVRQGYFFKAKDLAERAVALSPQSTAAQRALNAAIRALAAHK